MRDNVTASYEIHGIIVLIKNRLKVGETPGWKPGGTLVFNRIMRHLHARG